MNTLIITPSDPHFRSFDHSSESTTTPSAAQKRQEEARKMMLRKEAAKGEDHDLFEAKPGGVWKPALRGELLSSLIQTHSQV